MLYYDGNPERVKNFGNERRVILYWEDDFLHLKTILQILDLALIYL